MQRDRKLLWAWMFGCTSMAWGCVLARESEPHPNHCVNRTGDTWCLQTYGETKGYCARGASPCEVRGDDGCVATRPSDDACYSPCGLESPPGMNCDGIAGQDSTSDDGPSAETESSESDGTAMGPSSSLGEMSSSTSVGEGCETHDDCPSPEVPACGAEGECVACNAVIDGDAACDALDAGTDVCSADGVCVECTPERLEACGGRQPICVAGSCSPCVAHDQCPAEAPAAEGPGCDLLEGSCLPADAVLHVDGDGPADADNFADALTDLALLGDRGTIIVHALDNDAPYTEAVSIQGIRTVALLPAAGERPIVQGTGGNPGISISTGAIAYFEGLQIENANNVGILVEGGTAWLDRCEVVSNDDGGIAAQLGASLILRNSFVNAPNDDTALRIDASSATLLYSTIGASFGDSRSLECVAPLDVTIRNTLLLSRGTLDAVDCTNATVTNSAISGTFPPGGSNTTDVIVDAAWFVDYDEGDFRLQAGQPFDEIARWRDGDPVTDIDGTPRPTVDGEDDIAGAHILVTN